MWSSTRSRSTSAVTATCRGARSSSRRRASSTTGPSTRGPVLGGVASPSTRGWHCADCARSRCAWSGTAPTRSPSPARSRVIPPVRVHYPGLTSTRRRRGEAPDVGVRRDAVAPRPGRARCGDLPWPPRAALHARDVAWSGREPDRASRDGEGAFLAHAAGLLIRGVGRPRARRRSDRGFEAGAGDLTGTNGRRRAATRAATSGRAG